MNTKTSYEVHTLKDGRWIIEQIGSNAQEALEQAKQLYGLRYIDAVKVIEERYNLLTNESREKIIYTADRQSPAEKKHTTVLAESIKQRREAKASAHKPASSQVKARPTADNEDDTPPLIDAISLISLAVGIVILGAALGWLYNKGYIDLSGLGL